MLAFPRHARFSEKPEEYSKQSESCQANEIFRDSLNSINRLGGFHTHIKGYAI